MHQISAFCEFYFEIHQLYCSAIYFFNHWNFVFENVCVAFVSNQEIQCHPAGIRHPNETKFDNHLQDLMDSDYTLNIPLIPTTPEEMEEMFRLCSHVRFKIPQQVWTAPGNDRHTLNFTLCTLK